jgi:ABC-type nitrate/sulfonate/bicarbonate transport system substrate-binding protein
MRARMRPRIGLLTVVALALSFGFARAEPVTIRAGWVAIADWPALWEAKKDLAVHDGKSYLFKPVHFRGTPLMVTALANNQIEIADLAFSTLPIAVENAGMDDLRVIASEFEDGYDGYHTTLYEVLKNSSIHKVEDLKGKVVATNAAGAAVDIAMKAMLHKHGLELQRDYTEIEAPFPAMKAVLAEGKAALIPAIPPFVFDPGLKKIARTLFTSKDAIGVSQFIMMTAREPFIKAHRAALVDFFEDQLRIARWYMDPKNHDAVTEIFSKLTKQPPSRFGWVFTKEDFYRDRNLMPDLDALQRNVDTTHELGFTKANMNVKAHADLSMVEEAAKRLN